MNRFSVHDGHFWLDGAPQLIQAGELHYFRTPADQWPHRLDLLRQAGFSAVATYIPWLWHQPTPDPPDVEGRTHPLRDLAGFLDLAASMGLWIIARPGPYIMAETINEGIPPWVFERYPQAALIGQDGLPQNIASYLHPDFMACVAQWYQAVFQALAPRQITRGGRILMIQLDNEMGMLQWVRNLVDINPDTMARFAAYLRGTHGEGLAARYHAEPSTDYLREQITHPESPDAGRVMADYRRFYRGYLREYAASLWAAAQAQGMDVPPVVNIHGFGNGGKTFPIGLSQLVDALSLPGMISATDVYPLAIGEGNFHQLLLVNAMTRAVQNPQQPLFSIEFQAGGNNDFSGAQSSLYDLHSRLCIASGMRAINHYLFFDGENDPQISPVKRHDWGHPVRKDGSVRRHYARYPRLAQTLAAYGEALVRARPQIVATIGVQLDDFMTEVNNPVTQEATAILTHQREVILFDFIARGLALTHRPFDAVELSRAALDPAATPVLWAMIERQCDAAVQQKLVDYARAGGRLILAGRLCQEDRDGQPCTLLRDALGVTAVEGGQPFRPDALCAFGYSDAPASFVETYSGHFDAVFATRCGGGVAGFIKAVGRGQALMLGAALAANTLDDLDIFHHMANAMSCAPLFALSDWADVSLALSDDGAFLFINNYQDDPLATTIACQGNALLGGHAVRLPARRGAILPLDWQVRPGIVLHYSTSEIVAIEEEDGCVVLRADPPEWSAEISLSGFRCDEALIVRRVDAQRMELYISDGRLALASEAR